jgi:hypothetical protein
MSLKINAFIYSDHCHYFDAGLININLWTRRRSSENDPLKLLIKVRFEGMPYKYRMLEAAIDGLCFSAIF